MMRHWRLVIVALVVVSLVWTENAAASVQAENFCPPWPPPTGPTVMVSTESELRTQASSAAAGTTILVAAGVYNLQEAVWVVNDGITIRGASGGRDDVILDGGGMLTWTSTHVIAINADDVTVADLTIRNADEHGVSVQGRDRPTLYNLHIVDTGNQLVKVNPIGDGSDEGLLACSHLEYTTTDPDGYTNGISAHDAHDWVVRDNVWERIRTVDGTPVPAILFWSGSSGTVVERNVLVDCIQGIAFGNASHGLGDHTGGIVRNNFIYASAPHDVVIEMVHATGWLVAHNTALLLNPGSGQTWGIEARFGDTSGTFAYNLSNMAVWPDRDGAQAISTGDVTTATAGWFVSPASGDLHLLATAAGAIDQAASLADVPGDIDGDARPLGSAPDVGADEYGVPLPKAVADLRVTDATLNAGTLTVTLHWSPPANAVTQTFRYAATRITEDNWDSGVVLADDLAGSVNTLTGMVPYDGGTVYFAHRAQNASEVWSAVSNNAFWPAYNVYLPVVLR